MNPISVIIIAKNEAANISECVKSARLISNDIIVADSGSEDDTPALAAKAGARLLQTEWKGYGQTRNIASGIAKHPWVFALDADERVTPGLATSINDLSLTNPYFIYGFKRTNFLAQKKIRFGEWGRDKVYRLYHTEQAAWNLLAVHENITGQGISKKLLAGQLLHYTMKGLAEYQAKTILYARLSAYKYLEQGKKAGWLKRFLSPVFSFLQNYFFRLGFLDGKEGWVIAFTSARYNFLKYQLLHSLLQKRKG